MKIRSTGGTHVGRVRSSNEDHYGIFENLGLYVVADGIGGHAAGEVASVMAVDTIRYAFEAGLTDRTRSTRTPFDPARRLVAAIEDANTRIFDAGQQDPSLSGMGTTVAAVWIDGDTARIAHVGDSRVYLFRERAYKQITADHSFVNDSLSRGLMTPDEAATHPMKHVLVRALGTGPSVEVDVTTVALAQDDLFLLCSDGLSNLVSPSDLLAALGSPSADLKAQCQHLIDLANKFGGIDNITAVLVHAAPDP